MRRPSIAGLCALLVVVSGCSADITTPESGLETQEVELGGGAGQQASTCSPVDIADTVCDGIDEDCDGKIDEDCDFGPANCPPGTRILLGTRGDDVLIGTQFRDCILGFGGNDTIYGLNGDDVLVGGPGDDMIYGGNGNDVIYGGDGADVIEGGNGKDTIYGGDGNDRIDGGNGNDVIYGGRCHDVINGGLGLDFLYGEDGADRVLAPIIGFIDGGPGTDACLGANCEVSPLARACTKDADCKTGRRCVVATGVCVSPDEVAFTDETCDGVDDDCDGKVDEDFDGAETHCGVGACAATGSAVCEDGEVVDSCTPGTPAADDATCDGIDDDCDGRVDEDYAPVVTTCGTGSCIGTGVTSCVGGQVYDSCTVGPSAGGDATCDGVDDDCDGRIDEDYVPYATFCGVGACSASGVSSCENGVERDNCAPGVPAQRDATCDGFDDDCDGRIDEDFQSGTTNCGVGACAATGATTCVDGTVFSSCTPGTPAASDANCDGIDDDCNGVADEDFQPTCSGSERLTCQGGTLHATECDDGNACNGEETCSPGGCLPGPAPVVDDGNPCTQDSCDPMTGEVTHEEVAPGTSCSDGDVCNGEETCQGGGDDCVGAPPNAVSWWRGEGNALDSHGSNHGTLMNGTGFSGGQVGQAFNLDGVDDAVNLDAVASALSLAGTATIELWLRTTSDACRTVFHLHQDSTHEHFLQVGNDCHGTLTNELVSWRHVDGRTISVLGYTTANRTELIDGNWHHLAVTFDGSNTRIYLDGVLRPITVGTGTTHGRWGNFPTPVNARIGARALAGGNVNVFRGALDEVTLYDRALSAAEVAAIFNAGAGGKCTGAESGGGALTCTPGNPAPGGTACGAGSQCDGAGACLP
jgi:hypothetical protein